MEKLHGKKERGIGQLDFSSSNLEEYLKIELCHLMDTYGLEKTIKNYTDKLGGNERYPTQSLDRGLFKLLTNFYAFLPVARYSSTILDESSTHKKYTENQYNSFVTEKYRNLVAESNRLIRLLFQNLATQIGFKSEFQQDVDMLEASVIYHFYDFIVKSLDLTLKSYRSCARANLKSVVQGLEDIPQEIAQRFVLKVATPSEIYGPECRIRLLSNKYKRYAGPYRASYWEQIISNEKNKTFFQRIGEQIERFLTEREAPFNRYMVAFVLLVVTKYHILLHQHARYEFRNLRQHINEAKADDKVLKRAQSVFTFTRLIAKYFSSIFVADSEEKSRAFAKVIEILSYLRRGFAFELLEDPVKAFNDFTSAEKQTSVLRDQHGESKEELVALYQEVMVPYIYSLKGELYRKNFAYYNAHQYFCNSMSRFEGSMRSEGEIKRLLDSSLRIPRTQLAKGKTFFQLGEFRKALKWYLKALKRLLSVLNLDQSPDFSDVLDYLERIRLDPKLKKKALFDKLDPLTEKVIEMVINGDAKKLRDYGVLLSDFFNRIGLLVLMFNLPDYDLLKNQKKQFENENSLDNFEKLKEGMCRNLLAGKWLVLALCLNPCNSLARFNELFFDLESACKATWKELENQKQRLKVMPLPIPEACLTVAGEPRDIVYHLIAKRTLECLRRRKEEGTEEEGTENEGKSIAKSLLQRLLLHTAEFSTRNAELYKYLTKCGQIVDSDEIRFYVLRRWSSINPALPRPSAFKMKGGGYFVTFKGKGIVIDPGINFVENLYSEGFSIADIDFILSTHDHIDHIAEIDTILSLHYKRCKVDKTQKRPLTLVLNPSVSVRYGFLVNQDPDLFRKIELTTQVGRIGIFDNFAVEPKPVVHRDICSPVYSNSIGLILVFYPGNEEREFKIGITGDTRYHRQEPDGTYSGAPVTDQFLDTDILIAHINGTPFRELKAYCQIGLEDQELLNVLKEMDASDHPMRPLVQQLKYSLGYDIEDQVSKIFDLPGQLKTELMKLDGEHLFLHGVLETYKKFVKKNLDKQRLFVIAETNEEMGSYRHKVAKLLNKMCGQKCMTGDIGMAIRVKLLERNAERRIEVRCSRCNLNNDYMDDDKFHGIKNINEVCLKWEEDGLMYYCRRHDPETIDREIVDYGFAERIERYQPLRHIDIRIR